MARISWAPRREVRIVATGHTRACQFRLTDVQQVKQLAKAVDSSDPAVGLAAVVALRTLVDELEALHVDNARRQGWSWQAIADVLGITRQSVHKKHRTPRGRLRP